LNAPPQAGSPTVGGEAGTVAGTAPVSVIVIAVTRPQ